MTRFMLFVRHDPTLGVPPMTEWDPAAVAAHMDYLRALNQALVESGELVEATALTDPELAKVVTAGGTASPVVTDGPFPEAKEVLAGYQTVDVESEQRALEIAARVSAAPGPDGTPIGQRIEVRQVMFRFGEDG